MYPVPDKPDLVLIHTAVDVEVELDAGTVFIRYPCIGCGTRVEGFWLSRGKTLAYREEQRQEGACEQVAVRTFNCVFHIDKIFNVKNRQGSGLHRCVSMGTPVQNRYLKI